MRLKMLMNLLHEVSGKRTAFVETMYILDLSLDQRCADLPVKPVP